MSYDFSFYVGFLHFNEYIIFLSCVRVVCRTVLYVVLAHDVYLSFSFELIVTGRTYDKNSLRWTKDVLYTYILGSKVAVEEILKRDCLKFIWTFIHYIYRKDMWYAFPTLEFAWLFKKEWLYSSIHWSNGRWFPRCAFKVLPEGNYRDALLMFYLKVISEMRF